MFLLPRAGLLFLLEMGLILGDGSELDPAPGPLTSRMASKPPKGGCMFAPNTRHCHNTNTSSHHIIFDNAEI